MTKGIFSSLILGSALFASAYCMRDALLSVKRLGNRISVRGLAERVVKSNQAVWRMNYVVSGESLQIVYNNLASAEKELVEFFSRLGIAHSSVQVTHPTVVDNSLSSYNAARKPKYSARASVIVTTENVDIVRAGVTKTAGLVEQGIVLEGSEVKYYFTKLNEVKPEMLQVASKNALAAAQALSRDTGVQLGDVVGVSQGLFSITSPISDERYEAPLSLMKKVRVVTKATYTLKE